MSTTRTVSIHCDRVGCLADVTGPEEMAAAVMGDNDWFSLEAARAPKRGGTIAVHRPPQLLHLCAACMVLTFGEPKVRGL